MCALQRGLGKGLEALLSSNTPDKSQESDIKQLRLQDVIPNRYQPRRHFSEDSLQELAQSISAKGVLQPILVRPLPDDDSSIQKFELIAGERRLRASQLAGIKRIPAIVRQMSDDESLVLAMIENLQREDLNPMDEAFGLASIQERLGINQEELAKTVGKSRPAVANSLRLLQLPDDIQAELRDGKLSAGHCRTLLGLDELDAQLTLRDIIIADQLSVRQTEQAVSYYKEHGQLPDTFNTPITRTPSARKPAAEPHSVLLNLQERMRETYSLRVAVKGSPEKGKVILSYKSQDEFDKLLEVLGMGTLEAAK